MNPKLSSQRGVTLIELMISLVLGLAVIGGLGQVFLSNKSSYSLQERLGQLQENGRYALYFLQRDIRNAGQPFDDTAAFVFVPALTLNGAGNASDQITIRYTPEVAGNDCLGNGFPAGVPFDTTYSINVDAATGVSRLRCSAQGQPAQPIVDGIENLQILYGLDRTGDTFADVYVRATDLAADEWRQGVVAVRVSILASAISPITGDTAADNTRQFTLLDAPPVGPLQKNDPPPSGALRGIRGRVFTTTIAVRNRTT